jgi:NAD-dependent dihydropyrimidine dehydrogenase PreA subunit
MGLKLLSLLTRRGEGLKTSLSMKIVGYRPQAVQEMCMRRSERFPGVVWKGGAGNFIGIDEEKCVGCANCVKVCMGECFEIANGKAKVKSLDFCIECAACMYVCETGAIKFSWPKGGTGYKFSWG